MSNTKMGPVRWQVLVQIFEAVGFTEDRQSGSHIIMVKEGIKRPLVIPKYPNVGLDIIKANCKTAGITRKQYLELAEAVG